MELISITISLVFLVGLVLCPIYILKRLSKAKKKYKFISYLTIGLISTFLIILTFAWWAYTSDSFLLVHYGYNIDGMNETEFYGKVSPENMERVKSLETSIMGIGWPLKAIFGFTYVFFYPFIVFFGDKLISNLKKNMT